MLNVYLPTSMNPKSKPVRVSKQIAYCLLYVQILRIRDIRSETLVN